MPLADLKTRFQQLADRIDALSLRERGIIFVGVLAVLYVAAVNLAFTPLQTEKDKLQKQLHAKREQIQTMESQLQSIVSGGADPDAAKREKYAALQGTLKSIDTALAQATTGLVPPKEMARLVEQMLARNHGLQVVKVESLPAAPLLEGNGQNTPGAMVYKHGMRIELQGSYLDILRYLKSLEDLPWKVFWGQATLQTEKNPVPKLNLLIYTLSTHEGWIGL